ncbi:MAG: hypothetical protein E7Z90_06510 [Cyanobacteria bacterium SIG29]|nr:hypothetical protein [Cyanobacteria bacterium SIG29]
MKLVKNYIQYIIVGILLILCFFLYWQNMGNYAFVDTNETKFVTIAKDMLSNNNWMNIKLDNENFYNYPPLLFWLINGFCVIFEKISTEVVRMPISLVTTLGIIYLFFLSKNLLSKSYAFIITLIFATSLGTLIFSRLATTDMLFCIFSMSAILCASKTLFSRKNKQKIIVWALAYLFIAFATMTCGVLGFLIPTTCIITMYALSGNLKELRKLQHFLYGFIIFLLITIPWHLNMIQTHGFDFIKEYLSACNFIKYTGLKESFKVLFLIFIGSMPWSCSLIWIIISKFKEIKTSTLAYFKDNSQNSLQEKWQKLRTTERFLSISTIIFFTSLIFAFLYGAKFTYCILFLLFPASCITGFYWYEYIVKKEHDRSIFLSTIIPNLILIICSLIGLFGHNLINTTIMHDLKNIIVPLVIIFFIIPVIGIFSVLLKGRIIAFLSNIILMISIASILTPTFFNFIMLNGGQNDLISFSNLAKNENIKLATFIPSKKYSIAYYYDKPINYHNNEDINWLKDYLLKNPDNYVIVEIKDLTRIEENKIPYMLMDSGKRYCLIQHMPSNMRNIDNEEEPQIYIY